MNESDWIFTSKSTDLGLGPTFFCSRFITAVRSLFDRVNGCCKNTRRLFGFLFICLLFSFLSANSYLLLLVNLFIIGKKTLLVGQVGELVRGCHLLVRMMVMMVLMMMTMGRSENWLVISPGL